MYPDRSGSCEDDARMMRHLAMAIAALTILHAGQPVCRAAAGVQEASRTPRIQALLINGGGRAARNYQSHFLHVRALVHLLVAQGIPKDDIAVFASDGADPKPDLAVRDREPEPGAWLIEDVWPGTVLDPRIRYENSEIDGIPILPATRGALRRWFQDVGQHLEAGDTLFIYVTDHGNKNASDLANNSIVLWGEEISVRQLRGLLAELQRDVRVIALMSQCYSGSFAQLMFDGDGGGPTGSVCGYFSSTADRFAYGCYPENRAKENIGHSFRFIEALAAGSSFVRAHQWVLATDRTPDVPNRTSDQYLETLLQREARSSDMPVDDLIDDLLKFAWKQKTLFRNEIAVLDRVSATFGIDRPRSLRELQRDLRVVRELRLRLDVFVRKWKRVLRDARKAHVQRFLDTHEFWRDRLAPDLVTGLKSSKRFVLRKYFLEGLVEFTHGDADGERRLTALRQRAEDARAAQYRMEVRLGTVLRLRGLLTRIAGRMYLSRHASDSERVAFRGLARCEAFGIRKGAKRGANGGIEPLPPPQPPFPPLADDRGLVDLVRPGWVGIVYREVTAEQAEALGLRRGAAKVTKVQPDSPAERGGIQVGDIVLGPPDAHFTWPQEILEWAMLSPIGAAQDVEILRKRRRVVARLEIDAYPAGGG